MAAAAGGSDGEKSGFRWVDAARYAVAAVVTLLIAVVIVKAIKVVLRPEPLQLWVAGGSVSAVAIPPPPTEMVTLGLSIWAQNPSDRVRMYFLNITAYLFDKNTSAAASLDPEFDSMIFFQAKDDIVAVQLEAVESVLQMNAKKTHIPDYFELLYNGGSMSDVTLRLDGNLITEVTSEVNKTRRATYYCEQLLVGGDANDKSVKNKQKAICKQRQGT
ncbi:unnamed protein product [Urochloa decumbens]|uniref:Late embryogenesis abundant protein LEA-2 subgroup domain-containing protein n=1 Tax=Urochloa decumbens TaxID=240449 RepID=A0ABC9E4T4_9POAL